MIKVENESKQSRIKAFFTDENKVLLLLVFFGLFFRFLTITNIETGGDAAGVWFHAKTLLYGLPYVIDHHAARFGMIIPVYLVQKIFGTHPVVYYITPLLFYLLQLIFLYKIAVRAHGIGLAYLCTILLIFLPKMFSHAVQIKPDGFCAAYILICVYLIFRFKDAETKAASYAYILLSLFFMFLAYMTKETSLFFLPGIVICVWIMKKEFKYVFVFCSVLFALFLCETAIYYFTMGLKLGRIEIIMGSHLESGNLLALPSFWHLFLRYAGLNAFEKVYFFLYLVCTFFLLLRTRKTGMDDLLKSMVIIPLAFFVLLTFAVKSVNPFVPAMSYNPRHLVPAAPFMAYIISYTVIVFAGLVREKKRMQPFSPENPVRLYAVITAILSVASLVVVILTMPLFPQLTRKSFLGEHPFREAFRYHTVLNDAWSKGIPLVQEKVVADRWKDPVDAVQKFVKQGYSLQDAFAKSGVTEKDYQYCLYRVTSGDYKTFKIFTNIFWDGNFSQVKEVSFPEMEVIEIGNRTLGFMVNDSIKKQADCKSRLFGDGNNPVVVMTEKPIRVRQMKLNEFLK